jgi:hypothetical protein
MSSADQMSVYPIIPRELAHTLADDPILIDGMKVLFDVKVALYPVNLTPPRDYTRENGDGA